MNATDGERSLCLIITTLPPASVADEVMLVRRTANLDNPM